MVCGKEYNENFAIILTEYGKKFELKNHFVALIHKEGYNIDKNKLLNIKKLVCDIKEDWNNIEKEIKKREVKTINGKTDKITGSRKGNSIWNIYYPIPKKNRIKIHFINMV